MFDLADLTRTWMYRMMWVVSAENDTHYAWKNEQERRPTKMEEYQLVEGSASTTGNLSLLRLLAN